MWCRDVACHVDWFMIYVVGTQRAAFLLCVKDGFVKRGGPTVLRLDWHCKDTTSETQSQVFGQKFCNLSSHRESRWLLCGSAYGERKGISALVKANHPIREDECPFCLSGFWNAARRVPTTLFMYDFWCMMYDAFRMGKHPQNHKS